MDPHLQIDHGAARLNPRRKRIRRVVRRTLYVKLSVVVVLVCLLGGFYLRLVAGPLSLKGYSDGVAAALASRIGPGWSVSIKEATLELYGARPAVRASGLDIRNPAGVRVVSAPYAIVSLDPLSLLTGTVSPRAIELRDLQLRALIAADGRLTFVRATEEVGASAEVPSVPPSPPANADAPVGSPVSVAVSSLLDQVLGTTGALDVAAVSDAKLTLVGVDGRERVAFSRVDARFVRVDSGMRRIDIDLAGPHGGWHFGGEVHDGGDGDRTADLDARDVPLADMMLLGGLPALPAGSDLKLSGHLSAATEKGGLVRLAARFEGSDGVIARPGERPIPIDDLAGKAAWNEAGRRLDLTSLRAKSGTTAFELSGDLSRDVSAGWQLRLAGHDAIVAGASSGETPFTIADVAAKFDLGEGRLALDRLSLQGDQLNIVLTGAAVPAADGLGARATVEVADTDVRHLFALWPDGLSTDLRSYLVANMSSGRVDHLRIDANLDARDVRELSSDAPLPERSLQFAFNVSNATLQAADGLPPLTRLAVDGRANPKRTSLVAKGGSVEMPDGRRLAFTDATFDQEDSSLPGSIARIRFSLSGGADAVASLLRSPALRGSGTPDLDPANVHGRADLQISLPLAVHHIPAPADLPLKIGGTLSDLSIDKALGREKLEDGNLAVSYDDGGVVLRGNGRIGGSPATIEIRKPRDGRGDLTVATSLDDAARTRRGMPGAPQLGGVVPVKITMPLAHGGQSPVRVEADLSRATVDDLIPGWTKPAGRPGRLAFTLNGPDGRELSDVALDAGSVQLRGHASLGGDGGLDKAEFQTLKLSPGDDLKVQLDATGPVRRVTLRGNVGDARPVMRWLAEPSRGSKASNGRGGDFDLDAAINILTGNNDEVLTGVTVKASVRNRELRALRFGGKFRSALVDMQLQPQGAGPPVLKIRSGDAGATLRFADLYKRMIGGELVADIRMGSATETGSVAVSSFGLKNEPALRRIAAQGTAMPSDGNDERANTRLPQLDTDQVHFTKLTADFTRSAQRVDYKDVVLWGPQVGFTLSGFIDYGRDRTDIAGTFIPAYGLNNAFSQVPVLGLLLGGDRNEGLFAVDFRVSGAASSPTMTVNPLSAVAPGILRKLFGLMSPAAESPVAESPAATGTTVPRRPDP